MKENTKIGKKKAEFTKCEKYRPTTLIPKTNV